MPSALKRPTLDELYRRLRDLDYTQVDERMAVMLNAILQMEEQGECRESATEAVLMVGYTTDGISNQEQTRWLSWNVDGAIGGFGLARNPSLSNNTEYGAREFLLPIRPSVRSTGQSTSKMPSMSRTQQTGEAYPDLSIMKRELERTQRERKKATSRLTCRKGLGPKSGWLPAQGQSRVWRWMKLLDRSGSKAYE